MKKNPNLLWIITLALGWLLDFLFWKKPAGINFAVFTLLCLVAGFAILWMDKQRPARGTLWLLPLILFFAAITFIRAEPMTVLLGVLFTLFLLAVLAMTFLGGRWLRYGLADYASGLLKLVGSMIGRPLSFNAEARRQQAEGGGQRSKINLWPILRGLVIAFPIVAIFAALLASADAIFGHRLDTLLELFSLEKLPEYIFRLVYILCGAYLLAGVFLHAASQSMDEKLAGEGRPFEPFMGFTESAIVMGSVMILFAAFVIVQFQYFFGGHANINIAGFTYSEYARRGFGELVAVAFFSLLLILSLSNVTRREQDVQRRVFSGQAIGIVALVLVMLVSAYQRLVLYEMAYGFSRLRTYTHIFLFWIGLLLVAVVVLELLNRERLFAAGALIASLGFAVSLSLLNVDGFIVGQNVNRAVQGEGLDVPYLVSLSSDSVPVLAAQLRSTSLPGLTRDAVGAVLFCRLQSESGRAAADWRSFTVSRWRADLAMKEVQDRLDRYTLTDDQWPVPILTPGSVSYNCFGGGPGD